jgi:hypothetical protein
MSGPDFAKRFASASDEDLTEIAFGPDESQFETEAVAAALAELRRRRANAHGLKERVVENNRILELEIARAEAPNEWWRRIFTAAVAPTMIIPWVMVIRLGAKGYHRKSTDTQWWWFNGVLAWLAMVVVIMEF